MDVYIYLHGRELLCNLNFAYPVSYVINKENCDYFLNGELPIEKFPFTQTSDLGAIRSLIEIESDQIVAHIPAGHYNRETPDTSYRKYSLHEDSAQYAIILTDVPPKDQNGNPLLDYANWKNRIIIWDGFIKGGLRNMCNWDGNVCTPWKIFFLELLEYKKKTSQKRILEIDIEKRRLQQKIDIISSIKTSTT